MKEEDRKPAPSDAECSKAWERIMKEATDHCLIVQAYGGTATLAMPEEQRRAGIRERVLRAHDRTET